MSSETVIAALVVLVVVLVVVQVASVVARRRSSALGRRTRRSLVVHRRGLPSIRGMLVETHEDALVLRRAELLVEPERYGVGAPPPVPYDGDLIVPWSVITDVQDISGVQVAPLQPVAVPAGDRPVKKFPDRPPIAAAP